MRVSLGGGVRPPPAPSRQKRKKVRNGTFAGCTSIEKGSCFAGQGREQGRFDFNPVGVFIFSKHGLAISKGILKRLTHRGIIITCFVLIGR